MLGPRSHISVLVASVILLAFAAGPAAAISSDLVISQVYGGGGNMGAPYLNDFIEIFNRGSSTVSLSGLSVQYASTAGSTWQVTNLSGSLAAGQYYLVQEGSGGVNGVALPTPDATGTIAMSASNGKVALVSSTTALSGTCPTVGVIDFVGYGTANCFEGAGAAPGLSNTTADQRNSGGCTETDQNNSDFASAAPGPRNTASATNSCATGLGGVGSATPNSVAPGGSTLLTVAVTPGTSPPSTGITVVADLTTIGGSASQSLFDDGTNGDVTAGDLTYSFNAMVAGNTTAGNKTLPVSIADAQARMANTSIALDVTAAPPAAGELVISQVYGGGGNAGAPYLNDFVELYNRSASAIDLSGFSVQYASTAGTTWQVTVLSGSLSPGQYYLVQEGSGGMTGVALPTADATGMIAMSSTNGKVALVAGTTALSGSCPTGASIIDFVGYGTANCFEGSAAAPGLSNTTADLRNDGGCMETNQNGADFTATAPNPRNTASPTNSCLTSLSGTGSASPNPVAPGQSTLLTVAVTPGTNPTSTGITVVADLTTIGGSASQSLFDDGSNGDATAGDLTYSFNATVAGNTTAGNKTLPVTIADAQARMANTSISLDVTIQLSGAGSATPNSVAPGDPTLLTVMVTPGSSPPSTGITVVADLTTIGGSASQSLFDDGTNGDVTAGDLTYSFNATVAGNTTAGNKTLPVSIADAQARMASTSIALDVTAAPPAAGALVISQVYGGGGNAGAPYLNDFVELYNRSAIAIDLSGFSVQYASAAGTTWQVTVLSGSLSPGQYYLVQEGSGGMTGVALPTADATGMIAMSSTNGKVALVAGTTALAVSCPTGASIIDFVGYGTANCFEGSAAAPGLSNTTADLRNDGGCMETNQNGADFTAMAPTPRNTASANKSCLTAISGVGSATPSTVTPGQTTLLTVTVTPGTNPTSTGITVVADLTTIGGSASQSLFDDGTNGDVTAGDLTYSFNATVAGNTTAGNKTLPVAIADAQARMANTSIALGVTTSISGTGAASPSTVNPGQSTLLTVAVTPGANPASTGITVVADLTSIGGAANQSLFDNGTNGDVTAGDLTYSFNATVAGNTTAGNKLLPVAIADAQARMASTSIALNVTTSIAGTGLANPSTVNAGQSTLLTVAVTPGANPASTGITVVADLTSIGGSASQSLFDNGTNGDVTAGDLTYSFNATVAGNTTAGNKTLPVTIADAQARTANAPISLDVTRPLDAPAPIASELALRSLGPNPFRGALDVSFSLSTDGRAKLELLDLAGRVVGSRDVSDLGAGLHHIRLEVSGRMAPGVYLVRLSQAGRFQVRRVALRR